jgi:hypothetical protein
MPGTSTPAGTRTACRAAVEHVRDIGGVVSVQDGTPGAYPAGEIQNPNDTVGGAAGGDAWRRAARRERIGRVHKLRSSDHPLRLDIERHAQNYHIGFGQQPFEMIGGREFKPSMKAGLGATLGLFAGAIVKGNFRSEFLYSRRKTLPL